MASTSSSSRDYEMIVVRRRGKFHARIEELGLSATSDSADDAIAELTQLQNEYIAAATRAGLANEMPRPARIDDNMQTPLPQREKGASNIVTTLVPTTASDSYLRFFMKSLIAAGVFIVSFGTVSLIAIYLVGNSLVNIAADAIAARVSHMTQLDLDVVSTGLVDTTSKVVNYIQRVPPERKIELQKNLHFIASELAPYIREVEGPLTETTDQPATTTTPPASVPAATPQNSP